MGWWLLATASLGCLAVAMIRALDGLDRDHDDAAVPAQRIRARATAARGAAVAVGALAVRSASLRERTGPRGAAEHRRGAPWPAPPAPETSADDH